MAMAKKKTITIDDIAHAAGVSPSTVSRVLNGTTPVTPDKRAAVLAVVDGLKYRPNLVAQGLARGRSTTVGVLTQDVASPFYGEILKGIEQGLRGSAYHPLFASGNWRMEEEIEALEVLIGRQVDGLIVVGGQIQDEHLRQVAEQTPLVAVGRSIGGMEDHCVQVENFQGSYAATHYLIDLGHRRIAHIMGISSHQDAIERREGYCRALLDADLEVIPD